MWACTVGGRALLGLSCLSWIPSNRRIGQKNSVVSGLQCVSLKGRSAGPGLGVQGTLGDSRSDLLSLPQGPLLELVSSLTLRGLALWEEIPGSSQFWLSCLWLALMYRVLSLLSGGPKAFPRGVVGLSTTSSQAHSVGGRKLPHPGPPFSSRKLSGQVPGPEESRESIPGRQNPRHLLQAHSALEPIYSFCCTLSIHSCLSLPAWVLTYVSKCLTKALLKKDV